MEEAILEAEKEKLALKDTIYLLESQLRDSSLQTDGVQVNFKFFKIKNESKHLNKKEGEK